VHASQARRNCARVHDDLRRRFGRAWLALLGLATFVALAFFSEHGGWTSSRPVLWGESPFARWWSLRSKPTAWPGSACIRAGAGHFVGRHLHGDLESWPAALVELDCFHAGPRDQPALFSGPSERHGRPCLCELGRRPTAGVCPFPGSIKLAAALAFPLPGRAIRSSIVVETPASLASVGESTRSRIYCMKLIAVLGVFALCNAALCPAVEPTLLLTALSSRAKTGRVYRTTGPARQRGHPPTTGPRHGARRQALCEAGMHGVHRRWAGLSYDDLPGGQGCVRRGQWLSA